MSDHGPDDQLLAIRRSARRAQRNRRRWRRGAFWALPVAVMAAAGMLGSLLAPAIRGVPALVRAAPEAWSTVQQDTSPPDAPASPTELTAEHQFDPNTSSDGSFTGTLMFRGMNAALITRDHDAFFQYVQGDALTPLEMWWANMSVLGATSGGIGGLMNSTAYLDDTARVRIRLGGVLSYAAQRPADAPYDQGRTLVPFMVYTATVAVFADGAGGRIATWANEGISAPWDTDELYAVSGHSVVVAGMASERRLIDATLAVAEQATDDVLAWYRAGIGETPTGASGFVVFVTADSDAFGRWMAAPGESWDVRNVAGMTFYGWHWSSWGADPPGADSAIAFRGIDLPVITMGPLALDSPLEERAVIVHEEVHALQMTDNPLDANTLGPVAAIEGWGRYAEDVIVLGGFASSRAEQTVLRTCVRRWFHDAVPIKEEVYSEDPEQAFCSYQISASMYAFAAQQGRDVFAASRDTYVGRASTPFVNDAADTAAWVRWLRDL